MRVNFPQLFPGRRGATLSPNLPWSEAPAAAGFLVVHPRYRAWLKKCGVKTIEDLLQLPGEIVCGHPDRHVAKVWLGSGHSRRVAYLKREHLVRWRTRIWNQLAGFGPVSRAEREAMTLRTLEGAGLPGPQWLAYGEDAHGRAGLLVDELPGAVDLRVYLSEPRHPEQDRQWLANKLGQAVAELHEAGFSTPELAAKHVFIHPDSLAVTVIDWQSAPLPRPLTFAERVRQLASLTASLAENLATPRERLRFLWAYLRVVREHHRRGSTMILPGFREFVQAILRSAQRRYQRSSLRDQRLHRAGTSQRLLWLAGEEVCVVPEIASVWPEPAAAAPFYPSSDGSSTAPPSEWITFADGRRALLLRFSSFAPLGRFWAAVREKSWRSPGCHYARLLFHLERSGIAAPRLLGFGQRLYPGSCADSFLVMQPVPRAIPLSERLQSAELCYDQRRALLREAGRMLRLLHDAGCCLRGSEASLSLFVVSRDDPASLALQSPVFIRLLRRVPTRTRRSDLNRLLKQLQHCLSRTDRCRVFRGYVQGHSEWNSWRTKLLAGGR